jgi:hypothetical protein
MSDRRLAQSIFWPALSNTPAMRTAQVETWPEQQLVHRKFTIRWTYGCMHTSVRGAADDDITRWQLDTWSQLLEDIIPQLGDEFVTIIDSRSLGAIPRGLWLALAKHTAGMSRKPVRRALLAGEGWAGDNHAEAAQLVTAGGVRVFRPGQEQQMIAWLSEAGTIDAYRLRQLLS